MKKNKASGCKQVWRLQNKYRDKNQFFMIIHPLTGTVKLPGEKFAAQSSSDTNTMDSSFAETKTIQLNSTEELYAEIRDCNFSAVGPRLSHHAKSVVTQYEERHAAKTVGELKQFVQKIPQIGVYKQSVATRKYKWNFSPHVHVCTFTCMHVCVHAYV